jgi:hypothetical protein
LAPIATGVAVALGLTGCVSIPQAPQAAATGAEAGLAQPLSATGDACAAFMAQAPAEAPDEAGISPAGALSGPGQALPPSVVPAVAKTSGKLAMPVALNVAAEDADAATPSEVPLGRLPRFSRTPADAITAHQLTAGWQPWTVNHSKTPTRYTLTEVDQRTVLHAEADSSASGLFVPLTERDAGTLRWTWKTRDIIATANNSIGQREDAPLRLFVAFSGDKSTLSLKDLLLDELARVTTGREMPYATLMYIWARERPVESVVPNPHTGRVRMIVVDSGRGNANTWRCHARDLRADYRKAFGTDPGRVLAVGLMTDTDNTRTKAEAWYGDIVLE